MGGQLQDLLHDAMGKLSGVERLLGDVLEREKRLEEELGKLKLWRARLERDERWKSEEQKRLDGRLQTGDGKFQTLERDVAEAKRIAEWCEAELQPKATSWRKKLAKPLIEMAATMFVGLVWWLFYHFLLIGPEIAKALKAIKDLGGHP